MRRAPVMVAGRICGPWTDFFGASQLAMAHITPPSTISL
jgi:hypothetical protein